MRNFFCLILMLLANINLIICSHALQKLANLKCHCYIEVDSKV